MPNYSPSNSKTSVKWSHAQKQKQDSTQTYHHYTDYATHSKPHSNQPLQQLTQITRKCSWDTSTTHNQKHTQTEKLPFSETNTNAPILKSTTSTMHQTPHNNYLQNRHTNKTSSTASTNDSKPRKRTCTTHHQRFLPTPHPSMGRSDTRTKIPTLPKSHDD